MLSKLRTRKAGGDPALFRSQLMKNADHQTFRELFFNNELEPMKHLLAVYMRLPQVDDHYDRPQYTVNKISALRSACIKLCTHVDESLDSPLWDSLLGSNPHDQYIVQLNLNMIKIQGYKYKPMLTLVLKTLRQVDSDMPSIMKNKEMIQAIWNNVCLEHDKSLDLSLELSKLSITQ